MPSSPYRGAKRKVGVDASPRMGVMGLGPSGSGAPATGVGGAMGPPSVPPRSLSAASSSGHGSVSGERSGEMNGYVGPQSQGQRSPSSSVSMPSGVNGGMGMELHSRPVQQQPPLSQPQPQQRQPSLPRQGSVAPKQGSVPPPDSTVVVVPPSTSTSAASAPTSGSAAVPPAPAASTPPTTTAATHLPPLPANVTLNPSVTRVKVVPLIDSVSLIPPLSDEEISNVKEWMEVDKVYEGVYKGMKDRMTEEAKDALYGWGKGGWWEKGGAGGGENVWGNRWRKPREPFDVRYPRTRKDREGRGRRGTRREGLRL
jgi:SWI/SNF-related matrix-associated actin-dependent regulator of chromatin subfamily B protein 1